MNFLTQNNVNKNLVYLYFDFRDRYCTNFNVKQKIKSIIHFNKIYYEV